MMERIGKSVWRYHDAAGSTSYLVVGGSRAAMIDCGATGAAVMPLIREITQLPVDLLLTHAHPDHYASAGEFGRIWLHERDFAALTCMEPEFAVMGIAPLPRERVRTFSDGDRFDLGGRGLIAMDLAGHTPGSAVFAYDEEKMLFCGDAVGSGDIVLMAVPQAYGLEAYARSLSAFLAGSGARSDYAWHAGHYHQADRGARQERNAPCRVLAEDMIALCGEIHAGTIEGFEVEEIFAPGGRARRAYLGCAGIVYCDHQK